jgi:hypothetical protein
MSLWAPIRTVCNQFAPAARRPRPEGYRKADVCCTATRAGFGI